MNGALEDPAAVAERRGKLAALRAAGPAYPNDFARSHVVRQLVEQHGAAGAEELEKRQATATLAGRIVRRQEVEGETLAVLEDASGAIQICVSDAATGTSNHAAFRNWDLGDIVGAMGILYRAHAGELTLGLVPPADLRFHIREAVEVAKARRIGNRRRMPSSGRSRTVCRWFVARTTA